MDRENSKHLVTVIIPVYNVEQYLEKCLESIINQTYKKLQIILVNDGSTDHSYQICLEYQKKDERIEVINKENGGLSSARNAGLNHAKGEYCYFVDSDDYVKETLIEDAVKEMEAAQADLVVFGYQKIFENDNEPEEFVPDNTVDILEDITDRMDYFTDVYCTYEIGYEVWNKLYRTEIICQNQLRFEKNKEIFAEDICFNAYYLMHVKNVVRIDKILHYYLIRDNSLSGIVKAEPKVTQFHNLIQYICKYILENYQIENFYDRFSYAYVVLMHDQYKRVPIKELPQIVECVGDQEIFEVMSNYAYQNRKTYIKRFGLKLGDLVFDESYVIYNRRKFYIGCYIRIIEIKRWIRTKLKNL